MNSKFQEFKAKFEETYKNNIFEFMNDMDMSKNPLDLELIVDLDDIQYDSYGNEDSYPGRVFYSKEFDIFLLFEGSRCSYEGEEWKDFKEVKPNKKEITIYE